MSKVSQHINSLRIEFQSSDLDIKTVNKKPHLQFENWMQRAIDSRNPEPNAVTLATSGKGGQPDARIVLLREFDAKGFCFYTNYNSQKGRELNGNKKACLNFYWPETHRQVRILGTVEKLPASASNKYFQSRPRESQLGAWASSQSDVLSSRTELERKVMELEKKFDGKPVPRPVHWGGYRIRPEYFEFWQGRTNRLHDRIGYKKNRAGKWEIFRLNP